MSGLFLGEIFREGLLKRLKSFLRHVSQSHMGDGRKKMQDWQTDAGEGSRMLLARKECQQGPFTWRGTRTVQKPGKTGNKV